MKWDMGWMHDTLEHGAGSGLSQTPSPESHLSGCCMRFKRTFCCLSPTTKWYMENSLLGKMPGDDWQKVRQPPCAFGYMYAQAAKKLHVHGRRNRPVARVGP